MKTDTNIKMLRIFYKLSLIFFVISSTVITPGNGDDGLRKCGILKLDKPTILGRNVTFSFTPDMYDPNAILEWQRRTYVRDQWQTLPFNNKFTQYEKNMTYHLIITYSEESDEEKLYRVHYYNETIHCFKDFGTLRLEDNLCGAVHLRTEKVVENGTVEIEYYPSAYVMRNSGSFKREWRHYAGWPSQILKLTDGNYQETFDEENNKYVLTIYMFNISMNGEYRVRCNGSARLTTDYITVYLPGDYSWSKCGQLSIDKPTILGRDVTFSFTPETYYPNASIEWYSSMNGINHWHWTSSINEFEKNMVYYMITTGSNKDNDEVFYAVRYNYERLYCHIYAGKLTLEELPSVPIIIGLQDIENCTDCIVGEDLEMFDLACQIHAGSRPINVTMTIGNESHTPHKINSTTYMVLFTVRDRQHMENVTFSVMNDLLSSPLNVTAQLFVIKQPTFQFSVPEILKDGEGVNITCTMDDGRPNPNVYFRISGSERLFANSHFYNSSTSLNSNVVALTTFKKEWNKQNITCCRYNEWYNIARECSPPKHVNYQFPPTDVRLKVKVDKDRLCQAYATCTAYGSNPVCNIQFSAPSGIIGSEKSSENISLPHGAWSSVFEVNLNVSEEDNGKNVTCIVDCGEFSVDLTDTVKILLPPKPDDIKTGGNMNTSGKNETGVGSGAVIGFVVAALAVGILIGGICTFFILTRKGIIAGSKTQQTISHEIELTGPQTALDTYEQLQNRTDTEIRGTYDSLEVNSGVQPNSQLQYECLNEEAENCHTYTDLKESQ